MCEINTYHGVSMQLVIRNKSISQVMTHPLTMCAQTTDRIDVYKRQSRHIAIVMFYGCHTWTFGKTVERKVQAAVLKRLKRVQGYSVPEKKS